MEYITDIFRFVFFFIVGVAAYKYGQNSDKTRNYEELNDRQKKAKEVADDTNFLSYDDIINKLRNKDYK